jgi:hypothetical protein
MGYNGKKIIQQEYLFLSLKLIACQEISCVLWKKMTHYSVPKALELVPCLS